ncbi:hypothetical protein T07_14776 [Trichinella nelsoni]|uniref:Uncharacterized protein n=1 Tax=Trichinella nelsoni TaxID=6336 RepID=A0A0V0RM19_9BILA|nr:hypothetical protein T07_14776 [Trichinella nelsoni]
MIALTEEGPYQCERICFSKVHIRRHQNSFHNEKGNLLLMLKAVRAGRTALRKRCLPCSRINFPSMLKLSAAMRPISQEICNQERCG